jgi:hypothetical protein
VRVFEEATWVHAIEGVGGRDKNGGWAPCYPTWQALLQSWFLSRLEVLSTSDYEYCSFFHDQTCWHYLLWALRSLLIIISIETCSLPTCQPQAQQELERKDIGNLSPLFLLFFFFLQSLGNGEGFARP